MKRRRNELGVLREDGDEVRVDDQTARHSRPRVDDDGERGFIGELERKEERESGRLRTGEEETRKGDASPDLPPRSSFAERPG